ncbi:unnamed protein product [Chrysoparadoxa australica]
MTSIASGASEATVDRGTRRFSSSFIKQWLGRLTSGSGSTSSDTNLEFADPSLPQHRQTAGQSRTAVSQRRSLYSNNSKALQNAPEHLLVPSFTSGAAGLSGDVAVAAGAQSGDYVEVVLDLDLTESSISGAKYIASGAMCDAYSGFVKGKEVAIKRPRPELAGSELDAVEKDLALEMLILGSIQHEYDKRACCAVPTIHPALSCDPSTSSHPSSAKCYAMPCVYLNVTSLCVVSPTHMEAPSHLARNILSLEGGGRLDNGRRFLTLELFTEGTLRAYLSTMAATSRATWSDVLDKGIQLASAMEHLHDLALEGCTVIHRDLKPDNIGISGNGVIKVFDFGLAKVVEHKSRNSKFGDDVHAMTVETGSPRYMAPEVALHEPYNEKVDVYSFALIMWEMRTLQKPFLGLSVAEFHQRVLQMGERPHINPRWDPEIIQLLEDCWSRDIIKRHDFCDIRPELQCIQVCCICPKLSEYFKALKPHLACCYQLNSSVLLRCPFLSIKPFISSRLKSLSQSLHSPPHLLFRCTSSTHPTLPLVQQPPPLDSANLTHTHSLLLVLLLLPSPDAPCGQC